MDPANTRAQSRSDRGLEREREQLRTSNPPHPSRGGTRGYPIWQRIRALDSYDINLSYAEAADRIGCSQRSVLRWQSRLSPYRMCGGTSKLHITGADQLLLSICLYIYPEASTDELCTFIIANGGDVYSRQIVSRRCGELGLTRKRSSREAYDTFSPDSLRKALWFRSEPPPLGIRGVDIYKLCDIDETGFYLKSCARKYGRGHTTCRVRHPSHYTRNERKVNVIMGVEPGNPNLARGTLGSREAPRRWIYMTQDSVDQFVFGDFVNIILSNIEDHPVADGYDDEKCIMWDNLSVHTTAYVTNVIRDRASHNNFYSVNRPPYRPKIAPIEYIFCELAAELERRCLRSWTIVDLRANIQNILSTIGRNGKLYSTFIHCNYPVVN